MDLVRLARHAMATRFEVLLYGDNPVSLRAAAEEALDEIERLEGRLSLFRPTSEIAHLNARAAYEPVQVSPAVFGLLQHAQRLSQETQGAFDVTIAPLVRCWGFMGGGGSLPTPEEVAAAREKVGMHLVRLDPSNYTVQFEREGVMLDLGAIGKGYAIDTAVELLRDAGVQSAFIHGGTSTVYGLGHPPDADCWTIEIPRPGEHAMTTIARPALVLPSPEAGVLENSYAPFALVNLRDESLSFSAVWGKSFEAQGRTFGHIIDPRTGEPANRAVLAAVALSSATETDALSTALLTLGPAGHDAVAGLRPNIRTLVAADPTPSGLKAQGIAVRITSS